MSKLLLLYFVINVFADPGSQKIFQVEAMFGQRFVSYQMFKGAQGGELQRTSNFQSAQKSSVSQKDLDYILEALSALPKAKHPKECDRSYIRVESFITPSINDTCIVPKVSSTRDYDHFVRLLDLALKR